MKLVSRANKNKTENKTELLIGVLIGAVIVLGFFAFYQQPAYFSKGMPTGMHSTNNIMGSNMMMQGMMGNNMMSGAHTDADADGKCDMCGMSIEMCKGMKLGER